MRSSKGMCLAIVAICGVVVCRQVVASASPPQPTPAAQQQAAALAQESPREANDRYVKQILDRIGDRKDEPAEQVFKNLQWFKGLPAERLLLIMSLGYARALGVKCTHCHVEQDFASDDKRPKRAAREMAIMHRAINEQLKKMQNL